VASLDRLEVRAHQLLLAYSMTSIVRAGMPSTSRHRRPGSSEPSGMNEHPAEYWRDLVATNCGTVEALEPVVRGLAEELDQVRRRPLAPVVGETLEDLQDAILSRGEGASVLDVSIALKCSQTLVRRIRLASGRDPEYGRALTLGNGNGALDGAELVRLGFSLRAASMLSGTPRATLHDRLRRA
jgi:hypothetical protein